MKKLSLGFPVVLFFFVTIFAYADLIAHWPMNEGSGKEIKDVVGKGGVGKFVGSPKWVSGKLGKALEFSTGNYVQVESNPDLKPKSVTVTMWVYFNDVAPPRQDFFSKSDDYALSLHEWGNDGKIWPIITSAGDWVVVSGKTQIAAKRWYHVALVYGEKDKKLMSYVDGGLDATIDAPSGLEQRIGGPLTLGTYTDRFLKGMLDEVKIWNEDLSEDKIKTDMKGAATVNLLGRLGVTWGRIKDKRF
jgi:hypothetical protein